MGGMPPLGYDVKNRRLVVNDAEARIVVDIFRRYLKLKSVHALQDELGAAGIKSKRRMRPNGSEYGGQKFSRGALYLILQNHLYRGEIFHKGNIYSGEHEAIVDQPLWDEAQSVAYLEIPRELNRELIPWIWELLVWKHGLVAGQNGFGSISLS
jgi:site-specific DNA recombinase